jgi:hypothetical protein
VSLRKSDDREAKLKALVVSWRVAVTNTDSGASESHYGAGYWDAFRQAADKLEAVLDGRDTAVLSRSAHKVSHYHSTSRSRVVEGVNSGRFTLL